MHPAFSVIFFTLFSGIGYGILALMGVLVPLELLSGDPWFAGVSLFIALGLVTSGLLSSTFHLRHPERAWRAISQWRSSWLSREGVAAIITFGPVLLFAFALVYLKNGAGIWVFWGFVATVMALITVYSTSMIYASLKSIPQWHNKLVPPIYLALGLATGGVWLISLCALFDVASRNVTVIALVALLISAALKYFYWQAIDNQSPQSTSGSATGLGSIGDVRQLAAPRTSGNWVMSEMGFTIARKHAQKLRRIAALLAFIIPAIGLVMMIIDIGPVTLVSFIITLSITVGIGAERWLFFAEAKHVVGLFYGKQ